MDCSGKTDGKGLASRRYSSRIFKKELEEEQPKIAELFLIRFINIPPLSADFLEAIFYTF